MAHRSLGSIRSLSKDRARVEHGWDMGSRTEATEIWNLWINVTLREFILGGEGSGVNQLRFLQLKAP
jgi:hypothetical protein